MKWDNGNCVDYRVGADSKVDLKASTPAIGGYYYPEALPVLKSPSYTGQKVSSERKSFAIGDQVKIIADQEHLREAQDGHGGWVPEMLDVRISILIIRLLLQLSIGRLNLIIII